VPCGCTANQSGGLLRRGTYLRGLRERSEVIVVDAGGAPAGESPYHQIKFEAILKGEMAMDVVAHNLGGPEAALGADYLRRVAGEMKVPFLSSNLRDQQGELIAPPLCIVERGGSRIAVLGVLSRRFAGRGLQVDDPREAILRVLGEAKGRYQSVLILAYLPEEELLQLAAGLPEADAIVGGPTGQSISPRPSGRALVASATNKGKFLVELETTNSAGQVPWTGKVVEMTQELADDADQQENLRLYLEALGEHDFSALESGLIAPLPAGVSKDYRLAGTASCRACHKEDDLPWDHSRHATAWRTLSAKSYHVDSYCQQCHTTGFGLPGGFESVRRTPAEVGVGCESCHGPSAAHARDPHQHTTFAAADQCIRCHDRENSPRFEYAKYWPPIRHGGSPKATTRPDSPGEK
jgi:hypothetical protein